MYIKEVKNHVIIAISQCSSVEDYKKTFNHSKMDTEIVEIDKKEYNKIHKEIWKKEDAQ